MNWRKWYAEQTNPAAFAVFWAATGKRPDFALLMSQTFKKHREEIAENIKSHNALYRHLVDNAVDGRYMRPGMP